MKQKLLPVFEEAGFAVRDVGVYYAEPADYPDIARQVAELVASGAAALGMIVDGAGIGSAMVANKFPGVRAALCYDKASARNSREHNHANVLTLGGSLLIQTQAEDVLRTWLATPVGGSRHAARVEKIKEIEKANMNGSRSEPNTARRGADAQELDRLVAEIAEEVLARAGGGQASTPVEAHCTAEACAKMLGAGAARIAPDSARPARSRPRHRRGHRSHFAAPGRDGIGHPQSVPGGPQIQLRQRVRESVLGAAGGRGAGRIAGEGVHRGGISAGRERAPRSRWPRPKRAVRVGAQEIDMVLNIGELRGGNYDAVRQDIHAVVEAATRAARSSR